MGKNILLIILLNLLFPILSTAITLEKVNPFIGTGGHGHTFPGAVLPHGMVQVSPDSGIEGWDHTSGYHYSDKSIYGFSHKHLSGTGVGDENEILFVPLIHKPTKKEVEEHKIPYPAPFNHQQEGASPGYYWVNLLNSGIRVELTATPRVGVHRYNYPSTSKIGYVFIDLPFAINWNKTLDTQIKQINPHTLVGYRFSSGWAKDKRVYFVAKFNHAVHLSKLSTKYSEENKPLIKAYVSFNTSKGNILISKVALSSTSINGAMLNLNNETNDFDFDKIKKNAALSWKKKLKKITVEGGTADDQVNFYTAMYHSLIAPSLISDVNGDYRGADKRVHHSNKPVYSTFSLWDTFRSLHPLLILTEPKRVNEFIDTMLKFYDESGMLPVWSLENNETNTMIGYHSVAVISEAYLKGLHNFDIKKAYEAMKISALSDQRGLDYYKKLGYVPYDHEEQSVSKTLEYAYDDWSIAQIAERLNKAKDYNYFMQRASNYKNVFDSNSGFMRPKDSIGNWQMPFDPYLYKGEHQDYTEANAWQYTWFAPHDINTLIKAMGGEKNFIHHLNELFTDNTPGSGEPPSDVTGLIGQYAHGNEPSHNFAYLYAYTNHPEHTDKWVKYILNTQYSNQPDGLSGNEDCGQMSAWYVFSTMGFYPVNPASAEYVLTRPRFSKITLKLGRKKFIIINKKSNNNVQPFLAKLNGVPLTSRMIQHQQIINGGVLEIT